MPENDGRLGARAACASIVMGNSKRNNRILRGIAADRNGRTVEIKAGNDFRRLSGLLSAS